MGVADAVLSVIPERYRKDASLIILGAVLAMAWFTLDARVSEAETAAKKQPDIVRKVTTLQTDVSVIKQETDDIHGQVGDIHDQVQTIVGALLGADVPNNKRQDTKVKRGK